MYGRFDSDLTLHIAAGGGLSTEGAPVVSGDFRLRYVQAAGVVLGGAWDGDLGPQLRFAIEVRPLFPALFLQGFTTSSWFVDLLLQSLSLTIGGAWSPDIDALLVSIDLSWTVPFVSPEDFGDGIGLRITARHELSSSLQKFGADLPARWLLLAELSIGFELGDRVVVNEPPRHRP